MNGRMDAQTAVKYIVNIMNTLNHRQRRISTEEVAGFIRKSPQAILYACFEMREEKSRG